MTKKIIGTSIPLFSLKSSKSINKPNGTIKDGLLFLDWLKKTKQSAWQMLPIHETHLVSGSTKDHVSSPYKGYGIGIDPKYLMQNGEEPKEDDLQKFILENSYWLDNYAVFCAIRDKYGTDDWTKWERGLKLHDEETLKNWVSKHVKLIKNHQLTQYKLMQSYQQLRAKAKINQILLIGDLSFYLPLRSPLVWALQDAFAIPQDGDLNSVSGFLPLKNSSMYGRQVWGHPLYKWEKINKREKIYALFTIRLRFLAQLYNTVRIDHANGFFHYGVISVHNPRMDRMKNGPGFTVFKTLTDIARSYSLKIFAEDAAATSTLRELRNAMSQLNIAGFRILRYAYDEKQKIIINEYADISSYPARSVAYTTTHDSETLMGYLSQLKTAEKKLLAQKTGVPFAADLKIFATNLRQAVINSPSTLVIIPLQDWLLSYDRINIPGTEIEKNDKNWKYRMPVYIEHLPLITY